jgi:hypothetical protein
MYKLLIYNFLTIIPNKHLMDPTKIVLVSLLIVELVPINYILICLLFNWSKIAIIASPF